MNSEVNRASLVGALALLASLGAFAPGCAGGRASCEPACAATQECCEGTCVFMGMCGGGVDTGVPPGTDSGPPPSTCTPACPYPDTQRCCGSSCISRSIPQGTDGRSDPSFSNCAGCGIACDAMRASSCSVPGGGAGMARCMCGDFDQCLAGEACVNDAGSWICVSTTIDPMNCGMVGNACAQGESCVGGVCQCGSSGTRCTAGQACCAGSCRGVMADPLNCGSCGFVCGVNGPTCNGGTCGCGAGPACRPGMLAMGSFPIPIPIPIPGAGGENDPGQLCCSGSCLDNTETNCGMCGFMCAADETCGIYGGLFGMGDPQVCCQETAGGDPFGSLLGCGGGGFPFPGGDGGGLPGFDGGLPFP